MRLRLPTLLASLVGSALSLSASQASSDWHKTTIGVPYVHSASLSPTFHRVPLRDGKALVFLLTATQSNVLAAVDPSGSTVAWRHISQESDQILSYQSRQDGVAMLSGPGGSIVRLLEVTTGNIIWEVKLHTPEEAYLLEPETLGVAMAFSADESPDIFVLSNGRTITRLNGLSGAVVWSWTTRTSSVLHTQFAVTTSGIYVVGFAKGVKWYSAHITSLDAATGAEIASRPVHSTITDVSRNIVLIHNASISPYARLVWTESGTMRALGLNPELSNISPIPIDGFQNIVNVQLNSFGLFVGLTENKTSSVFTLSASQHGIKQLWEFKESATSVSHSDSIFGGGLDKEGRPYVSRTYWSTKHRACNMEIFAPHGAAGKGSVIGQTFPFNTISHGVLLHTAIEVAWLGDLKYVSRFAITTSSGSYQVWQQDRNQWVREESLSAIEAATFVDLPQPLTTVDRPTPHGFRKRLQNQLVELWYLPAYIAQFVARFATGSTPVSNLHGVSALRDAFGFRKYIIVVTSYGKVFALDSMNGGIVWSHLLSISPNNGLPLAATMRIFAGDARTNPEIFLIVSKTTPQGERTYVFHFDALSGTSLGLKTAQSYVAPQYELDGLLLDSFIIKDSVNGIVLVSDSLDAHVYPDLAVDGFRQTAFNTYLPIITRNGAMCRLNGYTVSSTPGSKRNIFPLKRLWTSSFGAALGVQRLVKPYHGQIASFGRVLGNRTTLYKYLNAHVVAVITEAADVKADGRRDCAISVVDGVKGTILYHAVVHAGQNACRIEATLADNWLVYSYTEAIHNVTQNAKGNRLTTVEMYEGSNPDDKTKSCETSSHSPDQAKLSVFQRSFVYPYAVRRLVASYTKFGITLKDIIAATEDNQVVTLPHRLLDSRRPMDKLQVEEQEGLVPFDPVFADDARRILSHKHEVARVKDILTSPSQLESTSLIFTYGLDLFQTRVSPSSTFDLLSEDFNRAQLGVTVVALALAIMATGPLVRKRALMRQWY